MPAPSMEGGVQILLKPVASKPGDFLEGTGLFKQMRGASHDFQALLTLQGTTALAIQAEHHRVLCADDLQGRCLHPRQRRPRQIGAPSPADHGVHHIRPRGRGQQRRGRAGTCAEQADPQRLQLQVPIDPVEHLSQAPGKQCDVETQLPGPVIQALLGLREQVEQQRPQPAPGQRLGNVPIARA